MIIKINFNKLLFTAFKNMQYYKNISLVRSYYWSDDYVRFTISKYIIKHFEKRYQSFLTE